ncbi:FGGY-family carbohydrate kinase [Paradesertivirga mongoliensis]|uniref:FGGY-family carbohydrate kinase n=1 Tax=Paradesertivirga mongoliensis TaxID=2100740 RepID=A0ABW4ZK18_9SPHI|nr:FGGY family carbohydrate kinase [Pedobacter mongoliensis]
MSKIPVIAVFDVGKTNKKIFFFDEQYKIVLERTTRFDETEDEDGDPCENLPNLISWMKETLAEVMHLQKFEIKAINFSAYGASFVHLDENGNPIGHLYNYLKAFPEDLKDKFYSQYGGELKVSTETASPVLGNLNSGMQLYRLKYKQPEVFNKIKYSLHLPQYLSFLITGKYFSDITSVGCHTNLWDFTRNDYHQWVKDEAIAEKLAPLHPSDSAVEARIENKPFAVGIGLHDSSAALIPFFTSFHEPFVLISTGTWCVSLNPFNESPLTSDELKSDCLCYISYKGKPVKASRLFAGNEHEQQSKRISEHFNKAKDFYKSVKFNSTTLAKLQGNAKVAGAAADWDNLASSGFEKRELSAFASADEAYHQLMVDLVNLQAISTNMVVKNTAVKRIFVDGGFSNNSIYMQLLASAFPDLEVFAASVAQATSIGAALAIHKHWNSQSLPTNIIDLKFFSASQEIEI